MIKKKLFKYASVFMCAAVIACSITACGANTASVESTTAAVAENSKNTEDTLSKAISQEFQATVSTENGKDAKEEKVYVFTDANGKQDHIIVNEKLKNGTKANTIADKTTLTEVENVSGDETSTGSNSDMTWNANGNNITYQGKTTKSAPVDVKVTYYLDGQEISAKDIAGKSGKVKIRFDYKNNEKQTVTIGGKRQDIYVPFTMVTGMMLPSDTFHNIEVTNGKVTETKDSNVVIGVAMPGLKDSLNVKLDNKKLDLDIPEYVEVTADAVNFSLDMTMTVASSNFLSEMKTDDLNINNLKDKINELQDGSNQLVDGTNQLTDGTNQLADGSTTLADGAKELSDGTNKLADGSTTLADGAKKLADGTGELNAQVPTLTKGVGDLDNGAGQIDGGLSQLKEKMPTLTSGVSALYTGSGDLFAGTKKLQAGANALNDGAKKLADKEKGLPALQAGVKQYTDGVSQLEGAINGKDTKTLEAGAKQVSDGLVKLSDSVTGENGLLDGMVKLSAGAKQVSDGSSQVSTGAKQVSDGLAQLDTGLKTSIAEYEGNQAKLQAAAKALQGAGTAMEQYLNMLGNNHLLITPYSDLYGATLTQESYAALSQKYMEAYAFAEANPTNQVVAALNANVAANETLKANGINSLADIYEQEMVLLVSTAANESAGTVETTVGGNVAKLSAGASEVATGAAQVADGATQVNAGIAKVLENKDALKTALGQLVAGSSQVANGVSTLTTGLSAGVSKITANNETLNKGMDSAVAGVNQLAAGTGQLVAPESIPAIVNGAGQLNGGLEQLQGNVPALSDGVNALSNGARQLKIGTAQLLQGAGALANGVGQLDDGAKQLRDGSKELNDGAKQVNDGAGQLSDGAKELKDGVDQLNSGAIELNDGMVKFNSEGINQITSLVGADADNAIETIKKVVEAGQNYQSFAGKADSMDGSVTFIYKTEGIQAE